jgi:hypothetical protein
MEALTKLVTEIAESFEDLGLYMFHHGIATNDEDLVSPDGMPVEDAPAKDFREKLIAGDSSWTISAAFHVGDVAWTDRVLYPETFETEVAFQEQMPTEVEVYKNMIREAMEKQDGEFDPFKYFDMMDGEVDEDEDGSGS